MPQINFLMGLMSTILIKLYEKLKCLIYLNTIGSNIK